MQLSKKPTISSRNFIAFEKNEAHSLVICDIVDSERLGYLKVLVLNFLVLKGFKNLGFK